MGNSGTCWACNYRPAVRNGALCAACAAAGGMPFQGDPCPACRWPLGGWVRGSVYRCHHCHSDVDIVTGEVRTDGLPTLGGV